MTHSNVAQMVILIALICQEDVKIILWVKVKNNQIRIFAVKIKMQFSLIETCPAHPTFRRLESDLGYYFDTDMPSLPYLDALEYCRTQFDMPTYFPEIKTIDSLREASGAVRIAGGNLPF